LGGGVRRCGVPGVRLTSHPLSALPVSASRPKVLGWREELEVVSKPQIAFKSKAQLDEKGEHIQ
jgi:hypothetical protein